MRKLGILLLAANMTSCSTIKPNVTPSANTQPKTITTAANSTTTIPSADQQISSKPVAQIQTWRVDGKIAVKSAKDSGSAAVDWAQHGGSYTITLQGPVASGGMYLTGGPGHVTMKMSDGKVFHANSAEQLLAEKWGFNLPVSNMRYWVRGIPVPNVPSQTKLDNNNRLSSLQQQGWNIQYSGYTKQNGFDLPTHMSITSPALRVKIVIYQWRL